MTTPRLVKQPPFAAGDVVTFGQLAPIGDITPVDVATVPHAPRDVRHVLHGIRSLLLMANFCLIMLVILLAYVAQTIASTPGGVSVVAGPVSLNLVQPGPDPALDYYAHAVFADGTERDLQLGGYVLHSGLVRVELGVTAEVGSQSACRIVVDGITVAQETATDGASAVCRWNAS